nr:hypothetical protein [Tanacetum cinerariifolium]
KPRRKVTEVPQPSDPITNVADKVVNEEMDDNLERVATIATSLDAEQDRGNIFKTRSKATPNEPGSQGTSSSGIPRCQETIGDIVAQIKSKRVSKISNDLLLVGVNTPRSGEDSMKLNELMELCTNLQQRVLDLKTTKITQALEIDSLKRRVKKLEKRKSSRSQGFKRLYKVGLSTRVESFEDEGLVEKDASKQERIADIDANKHIYLVNVHTDEEMFDVDQDLGGEEVFVVQQDENVVEKEVHVAQVQATTAATTLTILIDEDKGKAKMIEEPVKLKKKDQIQLDEEVALMLQEELQAKFEKEQRLANEKAQEEEEANIALIKLWDDVQAKIDANYQLAERLEAEEQQELNDEEKATCLCNSWRKEGNYLLSKKQKIDDDKDTTELKQLVKIIPDEEGVAIDAIPLAVKPPSTVNWKIQKEGKKSYYKIIKADGSSKIYLTFSLMLKEFDREDVETLWKLVKANYRSTRSEGDYKKVLWGDLKVMFDPHVEDEVWKMQQRYNVVR